MRIIVLSLFCAAALAGCSKQAEPEASTSPSPEKGQPSMNTPRVDACTLLTSSEIAELQGEVVAETKPSTPGGGTFAISQCYFALPTAANSVVLTVTQQNVGSGAQGVKEYWEETFHGDPDKGEKGEEGEKKAPPMKVDGVGEEAFWSGNAIGGALYALKGQGFIRISIGGAGDSNVKIEKSKKLAQVALTRL